jgi:uncharacterized membrane protein
MEMETILQIVTDQAKDPSLVNLANRALHALHNNSHIMQLRYNIVVLAAMKQEVFSQEQRHAAANLLANPGYDEHTERLNIRLSTAHKAEILRLAAEEGKSISEYVIDKALDYLL